MEDLDAVVAGIGDGDPIVTIQSNPLRRRELAGAVAAARPADYELKGDIHAVSGAIHMEHNNAVVSGVSNGDTSPMLVIYVARRRVSGGGNATGREGGELGMGLIQRRRHRGQQEYHRRNRGNGKRQSREAGREEGHVCSERTPGYNSVACPTRPCPHCQASRHAARAPACIGPSRNLAKAGQLAERHADRP